jgi:ABC-type Fe3+-hydroxamate transport system substrate-binding protein
MKGEKEAMKGTFFRTLLLASLMGLLMAPAVSLAKEAVQEWELINPEGVVTIKPIDLAARLDTLEGKTVALRWNGKPNGDLFLNRIGDLLTEKVKNVKIIKVWEAAHDTAVISSNPERSKGITATIVSLKPDLVIASSAD